LYLALFSHEQDYLAITQTAGYKIVVHAQDVTILPDSDGITVSPGTSSSIAISTVSRKRFLADAIFSSF